MYRKIFSKAEAIWRSLVQVRLPVVRKAVSRFLGRTNRRIFFEFLILICLLSGVGMIGASQWSARTIASRGNLRINGVGVYNDRSCSIATTYMDWGTLEPGSSSSVTVYIRNEGSHNATILLTAGNWSPPEASNYLSLNWNYDGRELYPLESAEVRLILSVSEGVQNISSFSFDITITAS